MILPIGTKVRSIEKDFDNTYLTLGIIIAYDPVHASDWPYKVRFDSGYVGWRKLSEIEVIDGSEPSILEYQRKQQDQARRKAHAEKYL